MAKNRGFVMFIQELIPIIKEVTQQPVAFMGGFVSGVLRLNLTEDPVKTWLEKQGGYTPSEVSSATDHTTSGGPQSISID